MKILITGGAGFIGSHIADRLLARGDNVIVIDNYATGRRDNLTQHPDLTIIEGDITNKEMVNQTFDDFQPGVVIHAAASYKDPNNWVEDARTNVVGSAIVTQAAERTKVKRLIYFQTALCYGLHPVEQPITLNHPLHPEGSSYAISKTAAEHYIALSGLDFLSFRLANAYGPRNLSGPLPTFFYRITTGKNCFVMNTRRDFVFVDDLVDVVIKAVDGHGKKGFYHISSGKDVSIRELYDETISAMKFTPLYPVEERERNPDDVLSILLDSTKTNTDFDWKTTTALKDGVKKAIDYYNAFGITETYTHLKNISD